MMETVGDILDRTDPTPKPEVKPFVPAVLEGTPPLPEPGIYFGVPEETYHAWPALSSHGIKDMAASPMLFWAKREWLSEIARKDAARPVNPGTALTRLIGKAYHARILEGAEAYAARFACALNPEDCKGALESTDEIKAAIAALGDKPISKVEEVLPNASEYESQTFMRPARKDDWIAQLELLDKARRFKILARLQSDHGLLNAGKQFLPFDAHEQIEISAKFIEADPSAKHAVTGGYPEVSLIWFDEATGVPMKARIDYLKLKAVVDLKTMASDNGKTPETAIARAIATYGYNYQPRVYVEGVSAVKKLIREDGGGPLGPIVSWDGTASADKHGARLEWAAKWATITDEPDFWFLFQAKPPAPITRLVRYPLGGTTNMITGDIVRSAQRKFLEFSERYGTEPWLDLAEPYNIADEDIPAYITNI